VVEDQKALEAARAFLQGRPDVDMDRIASAKQNRADFI
jgi:hypothetical protein